MEKDKGIAKALHIKMHPMQLSQPWIN